MTSLKNNMQQIESKVDCGNRQICGLGSRMMSRSVQHYALHNCNLNEIDKGLHYPFLEMILELMCKVPLCSLALPLESVIGKARILPHKSFPSLAPSQTEGRARESNDPSLLTSIEFWKIFRRGSVNQTYNF